MNYPFYTCILHVGDGNSSTINVKQPTIDQVLVSEIIIYQESLDKALIIKNRFGWQEPAYRHVPSWVSDI